MSLLVIVAHFDVKRTLRGHVLRALQTYAATADRVIVVSTSGLDDEHRSQIPAGVEFHTRANFGYDFYSYKWGLDISGDYQEYDQILITNDSFIGPTVPLHSITDSAMAHQCDLMGMTLSHKHDDHAQSFFMLANQFVARSTVFRRFWEDMVPISDRTDVIQQYEIGFSRAIHAAGFTLGSYFKPTINEERLAADRFTWHRHHRLDRLDPDRTVAELRGFDLTTKPWNPAQVFADRVLLDDRLPLLKVDTIRLDPYSLGATTLLRECENRMPNTFSGVRSFLEDTVQNYPIRPGEVNKSTSEHELEEASIGYCFDAEYLSDQQKPEH